MIKHLLILITVLGFNLVTTVLFAQEDRFVQDFLERLENSQKYLVLMAEMMPEKSYDFKATEDSRTFVENLMHIG